ncbi:MAG: PAS domain S-box protein [Spirochaetaceae bacterium]|nr:PAS domain S-box protein [Spirochaetaceae bacterium]MCF7947047.1 PAS domain S-box protein [Spirochaetia bacterium]MCF7951738.1 PAS domain S-box protein [Spirochaetaceae bacterium]
MQPVILIVHSDKSFIRLTSEYLDKYGFKTESALSVGECRDTLKKKSAFQLALIELELHQEKAGGLTLSSELFTTHNLPVVFVTKRNDSAILSDIEQANHYGIIQQDMAHSQFLISTIVTALRLYKSEHRHKSSEEKYRFFFNSIPIAAVVSDDQYRIQEWNYSAGELFGYGRKEVLGENLIQTLYSQKNEKKIPELQGYLRDNLENQKKSHNYNYDRTKDGRDLLCEWYDLPYRHNGHTYILSVAKDITEEQQLMEKLRNTVIEKEFLLRETHHRVKNSLNMINSLINLKTDKLEAKAVFADLKGKIAALSTLYEKLHQNTDATQIDLQQYIQELLSSLFATFSDYPVKLYAELNPISIDPDTAITIGLIVNEIATNAIKHGFRPDERSWFQVHMESKDHGTLLVLKLENSGNPLPRSVDISSKETLGFRLIQTLVEQIQGSLEITREPHPVFVIRFPRPSAPTSS